MAYHIKHTIRDEAAIKNLLQRLPDDVAATFTDDQLAALHVALSGRTWGKHPLDIRGTLNLWRKRYYFVVLAGKDMRELSRSQQRMGNFALAIFVTIMLFLGLSVGFVILYLLKSALGINLFDGFSLGLWDWFKSL
ncbi:MAG TPA: 3-phosphoshikimate 1-carboxyvinyltransferase [Alteromonas sp.]|nr:3-phosphoshikimate 1-carboxyvinyltransferase [Alteromonas sp.]|tara:strand:- start:195 stop:602 length:408 start_codon:yes stop_codon:yes gene_type:complete